MNMKTIILFAFAILLSATTYAQEITPGQKEFVEKVKKLRTEQRAAIKQKDYVNGAKYCEEILRLTAALKQPKQNVETYLGIVKTVNRIFNYDLACCYAQLNKKKEALAALQRAIDAGYQEYRHLKTDTDLDNIRKDKKFVAMLQSLRKYDKLVILQGAKDYLKENTDTMPKFTYEMGTKNLNYVREYFKLDSVAGKGDEVSKIINILNFAHNAIRHNGSNYARVEMDAIDLYNYHKATGNGINCRQLAIATNEMYLAMGIPSRYVTCLPKDSTDTDCHVINTVYSKQLGKWIWVDPSFNAYVKDDKGNFLSINEVRERLRKNLPMVLNEDANWNNEKKQTKEYYLDYYMAKNLYWIECVVDSRFNPESPYRKNTNKYIGLFPAEGEQNVSKQSYDPRYAVHTAEYFWQAPE